MHIDITPEALLVQLGYPVNEHTSAQIEKTIANTRGFDRFSKHLLSLEDILAHYHGVIALSNSHDYFKLKCEENESPENIEAFREAAEHWGEKYKVELQKLANKPTYYLIGQY
ncbi:MAG: hypothetical protein U9Q90_04205 [Campylobacterota bacterium]|nr:hypothetical protein [Campylobacterota bacterium]